MQTDSLFNENNKDCIQCDNKQVMFKIDGYYEDDYNKTIKTLYCCKSCYNDNDGFTYKNCFLNNNDIFIIDEIVGL